MDLERSDQLLLPVFGGQEYLSFEPDEARIQYGRYSSCPPCSVLLHACLTALHAELHLFSTEELTKVDICVQDFVQPVHLLCPIRKYYLGNPIISGSTLVLTQTLDYLYFLHSSSGCSGLGLERNRENISPPLADVLGFSSGILSACVVATSSTVLSFISHAVEAYRLALWVGIRSRLFHSALGTPCTQHSRPWAVVVFGVRKNEVQRMIDLFNKAYDTDRVHITAVIDIDCVTVSGDPGDLTLFRQTLPGNASIHETNVSSLYHCHSRLQSVRDKVLGDIQERKIVFPKFEDIISPIRSTFTGEMICASNTHGSLVELVVDMILLHPVHWDIVVERAAARIPSHSHVRILAVRFGKSLAKGLQLSLSRHGIDHSYHIQDSKHPVSHVKQEPIAVIGAAVNMPGANTMSELWDIISKGVNVTEEIPRWRFDSADYAGERAPGRGMKCARASFIRDADMFDHRFFKISPRQAKSMDPQQRILLQVAYEALEDAGYVPNGSPSFNPDTFACFIGASTHDYVHNLRNEIDVYYATGTLTAFLSGRLSYCLGFSAPSVVVDTACSSSLVAIHQAARALMNKDCNAALVGGVNIITSPDMFLGLDRGRFLSPSGQCKTFDAGADGYGRAEGCGIFVLKRLSDALAENDRIYGVIRGIEVNQSGRASSITHPHVPTQEALFKRILEYSDVGTSSINVVEAHGTGTQAGDTTEFESLRRVLASDRPANNPLYVTAIKPNVGHLEAASGCASLAKVLLMLREHIIPRQIFLDTLNPRIAPLESSHIVIAQENIPWPVAGGVNEPRMAIVNNFGAAGSNATLLVEEHIIPKSASVEISSYIFALSAKDEAALESLRSDLMKWLHDSRNEHIPLLDLSYTLTARRQIYPYRLAVAAKSRKELRALLKCATPVYAQKEGSSPIIFVFSGQGNPLHSAAPSLYRTSSTFKQHIDECNSFLLSRRFPEIISVVLAAPKAECSKPGNTQVYQLATFSLQYALMKLWISWGIEPSAVVGHSLGEYAALVAAGVLSLPDALFTIATRAQLMAQKCENNVTGMAAVSLDPVNLQAILDSGFTRITISCFNSPQDCVVSGPTEDLERLESIVKTSFACKWVQLDLPYGYHSSAMTPILEDLVAIAGKVKISPPSIPVISTVFGRVVLPGDNSFCQNDYFARHCSEPVRFVEGIASYLSDLNVTGGTAAWLEVGAHPCLLPMLKVFPRVSNSPLLATLHKGQDCWTSLSESLASLYLTHSANWRAVFSQIGPSSCISLPHYPFCKRKFWVPYREQFANQASGPGTEFCFIRSWNQFPSIADGGLAVFETDADALKAYVEGHRVGGVPLCPASVYLELGSAAITLALKHIEDYPAGFIVSLQKISFPTPLACNYDSGACSSGDIRISVDTLNNFFSVRSASDSTPDQPTHAQGDYVLLGSQEIRDDFHDLLPDIARRMADILSPQNGRIPETFSTRTAYQVIFSRVVEYSKEFHTIQSLAMSPDGMEATARVKFEAGSDCGAFISHPLFIDTLIHVVGFVTNLNGGQAYAYICNEITSLTLLPSLIDKSGSYTMYCRVVNQTDEEGMVGESYAILDSQPCVMVACAKGIRFQRVRLSGLRSSLASIAGLSTRSSLRLSESETGFGFINNDMTLTVIEIVARACNLEKGEVSVLQDLESLGIDSLMRLELCYDLSKAFPSFGYRSEEVAACRTVQEIIRLISSNPGPLDMCSLVSNDSIPATPQTLISMGSPVVKRVFAQVLDVEEEAIGEDVDLSALGLDSLSSIEASHILTNQLGVKIPANVLSPRRTLRDIGRQLFSLGPVPVLSPQSTSTKVNVSGSSREKLKDALGLDQRLWTLQTSNNTAVPLVLIHDGSGLAASYQHILSLDRTILAINNPNFLASQSWASIHEMAEAYATFIEEELPGPIILGGWSFGGVVAFELSRVLQSRSFEVQGVILVDSPNPLEHVPLSPSLIDEVLDNSRSVDPHVQLLCKMQFAMNAELLAKYDPYEIRYNEPSAPMVFLVSTDGYVPSPETDLPCWLSDRTNAKKTSIVQGWEVIAGAPIEVMEIPGHHFQPFESQNITAVSRRIAHACALFES